MQRTGWQQLSTTVINLAEIQCGIERQMASNPHYARGTRNWMGRLLESGGPSVWPLDLAAALTLARMYETPALRNFVRSDPQQKSPKSPGDLAVAAIAIANTAAVATRNVAHYR
jgi:predicted nucleic acid-binding protein